MNYSQTKLIELMKEGKWPGENITPKHIQTVISNVFVFENKVYKFYKNDNDFFNKSFRNLSGKDERFLFTENDFRWNGTLSPSIYLDIKNITVRNGQIVEVSREEAEEIIMIMNRVDTSDVLYEKLIGNKISEEDCFEIGKQFGESMRKIQVKLPREYNFYDVFESLIQDQKDWISSVPENISLEESEAYCEYLDNYRQANREWFEELSAEVTVDGDFHSHNAIYSNNHFYLMDTYPPKEEWGIGHKLIPLYRLGTDILGLSGKQEFFEALVKGYEEGNGIKVNRKFDEFYIIYAASIAMPYLYMLSRIDPEKKKIAEQFHTFTRDYFAKLK